MAIDWLEELFTDREHGASELEGALVEELVALGEGPSLALLDQITDQVAARSGEMGNLLSLVNRLWLAAEAPDATERLGWVLEERRATLARGGVAAAEALVALLGRRDTLLTLSRSSTVVEALAELQRAVRSVRVVMGEGRPLREGVTAARELAARGVRVTVVTDAVVAGLPLTGPSLPSPLSFTLERAAVVLGADILSADGVINKSGSVALAASAERVGLPVYVVADDAKLLPRALAGKPPLESDPVDLGAPAAVGPVHLPFERLDWELVTAVVLGGEILLPEEVRRRAEATVASDRLVEHLGRRLSVTVGG